MPFLLNTWPSAPIIIPLTALVVVIVFVILLVIHLLRKLISCPHQKSKYPIHNQDPSKMKSVLPSSPYTIDPSSTASSNSIYFLKGASTSGAGGSLLYPAIASAPSRSPSRRADDSFERASSSAANQSYTLDQVDSTIEEHLFGGAPSESTTGSPSSVIVTHPGEDHALLPRAHSASPTSSSFPYEVEERTTFRSELSYHREERSVEFTGPFGNGSSGAIESTYESDV